MGRLKRGTPPTYRCHKPTGQAVTTIDGKDYYLGKFDTPPSKAEYARLIAEHAIMVRLSAAACIVESITGDRPHSATLYRWYRRGLHGVKLQTAFAGDVARVCRD